MTTFSPHIFFVWRNVSVVIFSRLFTFYVFANTCIFCLPSACVCIINIFNSMFHVCVYLLLFIFRIMILLFSYLSSFVFSLCIKFLIFFFIIYFTTAATKCEQALPKGLIGAFVPQCNADGSFKSEQCWGSTGYCWCVDEHGAEIPGTKVRGKPDCSKKGNLRSFSDMYIHIG